MVLEQIIKQSVMINMLIHAYVDGIKNRNPFSIKEQIHFCTVSLLNAVNICD